MSWIAIELRYRVSTMLFIYVLSYFLNRLAASLVNGDDSIHMQSEQYPLDLQQRFLNESTPTMKLLYDIQS